VEREKDWGKDACVEKMTTWWLGLGGNPTSEKAGASGSVDITKCKGKKRDDFQVMGKRGWGATIRRKNLRGKGECRW